MVGSGQLRVSTGGQVNTLKSIALEAAWSHTEARRHGGTEGDFLGFSIASRLRGSAREFWLGWLCGFVSLWLRVR